MLLAHGAGAGMDSGFMNAVAQALAALGIAVGRFEFPYMRARREHGERRRPDPPVVLEQSFSAAVEAFGGAAGLVIGGKSMGGRIATMVADELGARGVLVFGYPFHPKGKPRVLRTAHLAQLRTPCLIVQGTRDELGTRDEVAGYTLAKSIQIAWIEDGDHSLKPRKSRTGRSAREALADAIATAAAFIQRA